MTTDPKSPTVLAAVPSDVEAAAIVTLLQENGVEASATGGYTAGFRAEAPGNVSVIVRYGDLERAKQVLAEAEQDLTDVDWSQVDVGKPEDK